MTWAVWDLIRSLSTEDQELFYKMAPRRDNNEPGERALNPIIIAPNGEPYLYRWHVVPRNDLANVYLHIQVRSDPERPLHDHPYDNQSVILAGGYDEVYVERQPFEGGLYHPEQTRRLRRGDVVTRTAFTAHRLILPPSIRYSMSLFSTGPRFKEWGYWFPDGWHHFSRHVIYENGVSVHVPDKGDAKAL